LDWIKRDDPMDWIDYLSQLQFKRFAIAAIRSIILMTTRNVTDKREEPPRRYAGRVRKACFTGRLTYVSTRDRIWNIQFNDTCKYSSPWAEIIPNADCTSSAT
jgi:hypothetical protein